MTDHQRRWSVPREIIVWPCQHILAFDSPPRHSLCPPFFAHSLHRAGAVVHNLNSCARRSRRCATASSTTPLAYTRRNSPPIPIHYPPPIPPPPSSTYCPK